MPTSNMGELYVVVEDPTITIPRYASRISQKTWQTYLPLIRSLYEKGLTRREMLRELSAHQFNPSFGQLVAQMTKWRLVRYSKPSPTLTSPIVTKPTPAPGIVGVSSVLLAVEPFTAIIPQDDSTWAGTSYELTQLISDLRITSADDDGYSPNHNPESSSSSSHSLLRRRELLDAAEMLFLGGSYAHAYHTYRDVYKLPLHPQASLEESLAEEQLQVQGIIGCLKSSATDDQREESIVTAQRFVDGLEEWYASTLTPPSMDLDSSSTMTPVPSQNSSPPSSPSLSTRIRTAFDTWHSSDFAVAKAIFDLLTRYQRSRTAGIIPPEVTWAHAVTVHELMCMRLVRFPGWRDAVNFRFPSSLVPLPAFSSLPFSQSSLSANPIFDPDNLIDVLEWTIRALHQCGTWYDEQVAILQKSTISSMSDFQALLFWRLAFFSKHSVASCPQIRVRLSPDVAYVAGPLQTTSVVACILLHSKRSGGRDSRLGDVGSSVNSAAHVNVLEEMVCQLGLQPSSTAWIFAWIWTALKSKLAPSFDDRCQL